MRSNYDGVLTSAPHEEHPWEDFRSDMGGGYGGRGMGDLRGVLPLRHAFSGLYGGRVPGEVP